MTTTTKPTIPTTLPDGVWLRDGLWVVVRRGEVLAISDDLREATNALLDGYVELQAIVERHEAMARAETMFAAEIGEWNQDE